MARPSYAPMPCEIESGSLSRRRPSSPHRATTRRPTRSRLAGRAFFEVFTGIVGERTRGGEVTDRIARAGLDAEMVANRPGHPVNPALGTLLARAQRSGRVRPDVDAAVVAMVMVGTVHALRHAEPPTRSRILAVVLDGLRRSDPARRRRR
ncbi:SbtR family transcriptional regulator [Virgisporangium aliadipatigenens]|uniref:SbtR family transcriptional regulator n=1 Tax=Virgisporangium aliadipatigenens TaxID=741659 RepID=UPI0019417609|nr:hypothetical protein [Virgisporangium aliadipatigenens]